MRLVGQFLVALLCITAVSAQSPRAPANLSPDVASYDIDVTLDPAARTLTGTEVITWRNTGQIPAYSVRLHMYWNAFRNTNSTWLKQRQLSGSNPFSTAAEGDFGYSTVSAIAFINADGTETDMMPRFRYISPDDQNRDDRSLAAADLPTAVEPGQSMRIRVAWTSRFPRNFDRTGQIGNYFFAVHWFPKLGAFDQAGWVARQFFANTEFFADFGRYDVRITVPSGWTVGATGVEQSRAGANDHTTHRYVQDDVHDFAWAASPDFVERAQRFEHPGLPAVNMRLLLQPEHEHLADRHFAAAAATLRYYGEWFGPYPYSQLTIIDPPFQSESGGMEYPTLFTGGTRWLSPRQSNDPEYVVIHEAGHQWWQGMVANNEILHAWLDEGINEYARFAPAVDCLSTELSRAALLRRFHPVAVSRHSAEARHRHQLDEQLPPGRDARFARDANLHTVARHASSVLVSQGGVDAAHARAFPFVGSDAARAEDVFRAVAVQAPHP